MTTNWLNKRCCSYETLKGDILNIKTDQYWFTLAFFISTNN